MPPTKRSTRTRAAAVEDEGDDTDKMELLIKMVARLSGISAVDADVGRIQTELESLGGVAPAEDDGGEEGGGEEDELPVTRSDLEEALSEYAITKVHDFGQCHSQPWDNRGRHFSPTKRRNMGDLAARIAAARAAEDDSWTPAKAAELRFELFKQFESDRRLLTVACRFGLFGHSSPLSPVGQP